jgi:hypothetical protein
MFLSGSFLGLSTFQNVVGISSPIKRSYQRVKIYGNATIDKLQIKNKEIDNETLKNIIITDKLKWTPNTIALCEFENNLIAGNIVNLDSPVTHWQISRRESGSSVLKTIGKVEVGTTEFIDYTCQQGKKYIYEIYGINDTQMSEPFITEEIETDFWGWYLIGNDQDSSTYVYMLDLDVNFDGYQVEEDITEHPTYLQFNAFSKGQRQFVRGTLSAIAGEISSSTGELLQPSEYITTLQDRIQDISTKILKSRKGEIYKVKTHGFKATPVNNGIMSQPYIVQFNFVQCEKI